MSTVKANQHQVGDNVVDSKNIVISTDTSTGDLVVSKGVYDGVLVELYRFMNGGLGNYANDTAAASAGVPLKAFYHTNGTVKIRIV